MPRVSFKKKEYMIKDLPGWIVGKMYVKGLKQKDIAEALDITPQAFCQKLKNKDKGSPKDCFSYGDLLTIFDVLDATDEEKLRLLKL